MRKMPAGFAAALLLAVSMPTHAHDVPASTVLLDIGSRSIGVEMQLPVSELGAALQLPLTTDPAAAVAVHARQLAAYVEHHVRITTPDGTAYRAGGAALEYRRIRDGDWVVAHMDLWAPDGAPTTKIRLDYDVIITPVVTHTAFVSVRRDFRNALFGDNAQMIGLAQFQQTHIELDGSDGSWARGAGKVFRLGMDHIAAGTDHVLFLLVLLLVAPAVACDRRWSGVAGAREGMWNTLKTVSGFTLGHSITLALGALGVVVLPSKPIEVFIAVSILVSAVHALRPLFAGREPLIAAAFGLVHGLAFAGALAGFNYDARALGLGVLGFNLGVEAMQLAIVAAVLPWLLLMRATDLYPYFRRCMAISAGVLAIAWVLERSAGISSPLSRVGELLLGHGGLVIVTLAVLSIVSRAPDIVRWCGGLLPVRAQDRFSGGPGA
jgi:hypothetical protein